MPDAPYIEGLNADAISEEAGRIFQAPMDTTVEQAIASFCRSNALLSLALLSEVRNLRLAVEEIGASRG